MPAQTFRQVQLLNIRFINNPTTLSLDWMRSMRKLTLGPYWVPAPPHETFHLKQQTFNYRRGESSLILVSQTQKLAIGQAEAVRDVLMNGTHTLDSDEFKSLAPIFGEQADHDVFALRTSEVIDWNGKLVIMNKGEFPDFGLKTFSLFIDVKNDGQFIEEAIYQAPTHEYETNKNDAMISLRSVEWMTPNRFLA